MNNLDDLLNIREASEIAGVSEPTIRKYLGLTKPPRPSRLPNARKLVRPGEQVETWAIPLSDLHNAGLMKKSKKPGQVIADSSNQVEQPSEIVEQLRAENQQLKLTLAVLEQSNTDLRANLADLRLLLGRSIETKEAQTLRQRLFRRNNQG
jgi:DNA-binding transcriptional MerR regulator